MRQLSLTYSRRSSGEKQSPLGKSSSAVSSVGSLSPGETRNTPRKSSSASRSMPQSAVRPEGCGSVKQMLPSAATQTSFGLFSSLPP